MKDAVAILVVLGSALLVSFAEAKPFSSYDAVEVRKKVFSEVHDFSEKVATMADRYMAKASAESVDRKIASQYAVAAQLANSVASIHFVDLVEALNELEGEDYPQEIHTLVRANHKADQKADERIVSLAKIASDLGDADMQQDVVEIVKGIRSIMKFLFDLFMSEE